MNCSPVRIRTKYHPKVTAKRFRYTNFIGIENMHKWSFVFIFLTRFQIADLQPFNWPESLKRTVFMFFGFMLLQFAVMDPRKLCHFAGNMVGQVP